jgi:hypothetical protein
VPNVTHLADRPPQSRSGRLLSLVRKLVTYGNQVIASLHQRGTTNDPADLKRSFGTSKLMLILARIALGVHRARFLEAKIAKTAASIDAGAPQPEPKPRTRKPQSSRASRPAEAQLAIANATLSLPIPPTLDQIEAKVRRESIGAVLADICRSLCIAPDHPLWQELHDAIVEFAGSFVDVVRRRLSRIFPLARTSASLKPEPEAAPESSATGPPLAAAA